MLKWCNNGMAGWPNDQMTGWRDVTDDRITGCQHDRVTRWLDDWMTECADDWMTGSFADDWPYCMVYFMFLLHFEMIWNTLDFMTFLFINNQLVCLTNPAFMLALLSVQRGQDMRRILFLAPLLSLCWARTLLVQTEDEAKPDIRAIEYKTKKGRDPDTMQCFAWAWYWGDQM